MRWISVYKIEIFTEPQGNPSQKIWVHYPGGWIKGAILVYGTGQIANITVNGEESPQLVGLALLGIQDIPDMVEGGEGDRYVTCLCCLSQGRLCGSCFTRFTDMSVTGSCCCSEFDEPLDMLPTTQSYR